LWWYKRFWLNPQTASALIYLVGVVMISGAVFQWVEEPANRRIRQWERDKANQKAKIFRSVGTIAQLAAGVENPQREESSPRNTFAF
jgi:peptidoglycan/LPS O-acetylase OafA/YrhL